MKPALASELIVVSCLVAASGSASEPQPTPALDREPCLTARGNGILVQISHQGRVLTSANGCKWAEQCVPCRTFVRGVAYGNSIFVAVGGSYIDVPGVILTSHDGTNWIRRNCKNKTTLYGVAHGHGLFVAV